MTFTGWVQHHRRSILFLLAVLMLGGAASSVKLPVSLLPNVSFPRIAAELDAGDRPASLMAIEVTWPVEQAVRAVPGVVSVHSTTSRGSAEVIVDFNWGRNMATSLLQVESAINQVMPRLPAGTAFRVKRMDPTIDPVMAYSLTSDTRSLTELHDFAFYQLRPLLSTVNGVSRVQVQGGQLEEYRVTVDPAKLASYGLSLSDVAKALSAANVITAVGRLEDHYKLYLTMSDTRFTSLNEIRDTVLRAGSNGPVLLDDVATVSRSTVPQWTRVTADGHDAVLLNIYQQRGGNTVRIAGDVKAKLASFKSQIPPGVKIANWYDQSQLITASAGSVRDAILIGVVLAAIILFVFLRNIKITLIAIITVPGVLAASVLLLYVLHQSFNMMTLGGMAAAVGLIIDDTIVMIEHIVRRLRGGGAGNHHKKIMEAAREFTPPLLGSSASTIVIFAPLAFLSGVTGAFFKALSLTMAASLVVSYFVAWLAVPLLADHLLGQKDADQKEGGFITHKTHKGYEKIMGRLLGRPVFMLLPVAALLLAGWMSYKHLGSGFIPKMDEGGFILDYYAKPGTSLTETDRLLMEVEAILRKTPAVDTYSRRTGLQLGGGVTESYQGDFFIRLKPFPRKPIDEVMDDVRQRVEHSVPGLHIDLHQLIEDMIGDFTGVPQPIDIKIFSDNGKVLGQLGSKVAGLISKIPGVVDVNDGIILAGDALDIKVDRVKAALEGVDPESVTADLNALMSGLVTTKVEQGPKMVGVRVWIPEKYRETEDVLDKLQLRAPDGHLFPLGRIATITAITGQPEITRDNLKRMIRVTGRISGRDMGSTIRDVKKVLNRPGLFPKGVYYSLGGLYKQQQIAFAGLMAVFAAAVALVFLLLLYLYESFRVAASILITTLLAVMGVFIGLFITGTELNISAMMGMTMIIGIATEVAIFYVSEYYELGERQDRKEALVLAGKNRMRPIAMTTFAAILALMPLALGIGQGAAMLKPLAIAIISGLIIQFPLVLTMLPVMFHIFRVSKQQNKADV
ncbi:MAG: efflux RND transporter permease subunit [Nitrospiraceae bacterium]|nr:efflux RND transporter permease subunit [Nitrospiraceae bacterium]